MTKRLDVYFHEKIIGELKQNDDGQMEFTYLSSWLNDPDSMAISASLPLGERIFIQKQCRAFFSRLLPEEQPRKLIAKNLGISANNDFSMLEKIGGECAGAIVLIPSGKAFPPVDEKYRGLSDHELANKLRELPYRHLLAGDNGVRLSLAGVQDKIAVYVNKNKISIPLNGAPSTHIIKPANAIFDGIIFNEAFCLMLARKIGLPTVNAEIKRIEDIDYLLIERYDRLVTDNLHDASPVKRLHQEDFCQALGIVSENKYQNEGGPSLKKCFDLLRLVSTVPVIDLNKLIDIVIFNFFIGNCDAHGKNFSLVYKNSVELSPFYDLVSTIFYKNLSTKMAMKLGGEYELKRIGIKNFEILAEEAGLAKPSVKRRVFALADSIISALQKTEPSLPIEQQLLALIRTRCLSLLQSKISG